MKTLQEELNRNKELMGLIVEQAGPLIRWLTKYLSREASELASKRISKLLTNTTTKTLDNIIDVTIRNTKNINGVDYLMSSTGNKIDIRKISYLVDLTTRGLKHPDDWIKYLPRFTADGTGYRHIMKQEMEALYKASQKGVSSSEKVVVTQKILLDGESMYGAKGGIWNRKVGDVAGDNHTHRMNTAKIQNKSTELEKLNSNNLKINEGELSVSGTFEGGGFRTIVGKGKNNKDIRGTAGNKEKMFFDEYTLQNGDVVYSLINPQHRVLNRPGYYSVNLTYKKGTAVTLNDVKNLLTKKMNDITNTIIGGTEKIIKTTATNIPTKLLGKVEKWVTYGTPTPNMFSGWKFHIFGETIEDAAIILERIEPILKKWGLHGKIGNETMISKYLSQNPTAPTIQQGKLSTIYLNPNIMRAGMVDDLVDDIMRGLGDYKKTGKISGDKSVNGTLHYRYELAKPIDVTQGIPRSTYESMYVPNRGAYNIEGNPDLFDMSKLQ